jgi:hypothetical protein
MSRSNKRIRNKQKQKTKKEINMKNRIQILALLLIGSMSGVQSSTLMQYELGQITSGGTAINGSLFFISSGTNGTFDSGSFSAGATSLINSADSLLFATAISGGSAQGNWSELYTAPVAVGQSITALFVKNLTSSDVSYSTGALLGGKSIGLSGGTSYAFGTYRNSSVETIGGGVGDAIAWVLPANAGATASLIAYSGTGDYTGSDFNANLATASSFNIIPEPSSASLLALGAAGLVALRVRRKS